MPSRCDENGNRIRTFLVCTEIHSMRKGATVNGATRSHRLPGSRNSFSGGTSSPHQEQLYEPSTFHRSKDLCWVESWPLKIQISNSNETALLWPMRWFIFITLCRRYCGLQSERGKKHLLAFLLLRKWSVEKLHHRRHQRKMLCQLRYQTRRSDCFNIQSCFQIPLPLP